MKKIRVCVAAAAVSLFCALPASADGISVTVNGNPVQFDIAPTLIENRTMVPLRAVGEALGCEVHWYEESRCIGIHKMIQNGEFEHLKKDDAVLKIDDKRVLKIRNYNSIARITQIDVAPMIIGDRTLVPIRAVAEILDAEVNWEQENQTVVITTHPETQYSVQNLENGCCIIDEKGKQVIGVQEYNYIVQDRDMFIVTKDNKSGLLDRNLNLVLPLEYGRINSRRASDYFQIQKNGLWGLADGTGTVIVEPQYQGVSSGGLDENSWLSVQKGLKWGCVDLAGNLVFPYSYEKPIFFANGLAAVYDGSKTGYVNASGETVIPFAFVRGSEFNNGAAAVFDGETMGLINITGDMIVPYGRYSMMSSCLGGFFSFYDMTDFSTGFLTSDGTRWTCALMMGI